MVVLVGLDTSFSVFDIKVKFCEFFQDFLIDRNSMIANNYPAIERNILDLIAPLMLINLLDSVPLTRIYVKNPLEEIFERVANKAWKDILS